MSPSRTLTTKTRRSMYLPVCSMAPSAARTHTQLSLARVETPHSHSGPGVLNHSRLEPTLSLSPYVCFCVSTCIHTKVLLSSGSQVHMGPCFHLQGSASVERGRDAHVLLSVSLGYALLVTGIGVPCNPTLQCSPHCKKQRPPAVSTEEIRKQIRKRIGPYRKTPDQIRKQNRKTNSRNQGNGHTQIIKPDGQYQKTRRTGSENTGGVRKSESKTNEMQKEPLQGRDGLARRANFHVVGDHTSVQKRRSALLRLWPKLRGKGARNTSPLTWS